MGLKEIDMKLKEAIENGFKYCVQNNFEDSLIKLSTIQQKPEDYEELDLVLCEPRKFTLSVEEIETLIQESIDDQDEFYDEDGFDYALEGTDEIIKALSDKINENFSKHTFWFPDGEQLEL